jgi:O-antigen ligase
MPLLLPPLAAAAFGLAAYQYGPLSLPTLLLGIGAIAVTLRRPEIGIAIGLTLIPLGNLGYLQAADFEPPIWMPVAAWATFLFILAVPRLGQGLRQTPFTLALVAYFLTLCVSAAIGGEPSDALSILRSTAVGLLFFFAIVSLVRTPQHLVWVLIGIGAMSIFIGLVAIREFGSGGSADIAFLTTSGEIIDRAAAGFGHPNSLGGFMVLATPLLAASALAVRRMRWFFGIALVLALAALYLSFSRASLVGVVVGALFFVNGRRLLIAMPAIAIMLIVTGTPALLAERFETLNTSGSDLASRQDFWRVAGNVWEKHPLVGAGPGSFPDRYAEARIPGKEYLPNSVFQPPPHAHNVFLHELSEGGLLGLAALLAVLLLFARSAYRLWRGPEAWMRTLGSGMLAALTGWLIHNMFDVTLVESPGTFFFIVIGILSVAASLMAANRSAESFEPGRGT